MRKLFFIAAAGIVLLAGCKKPANTTANCRLTKLVYPGIDTSLATYDSQGRMLTYGNSAAGIYTFTYTGGLTATAAVLITDTSYHVTYNISLNAQGNATFIQKHYSYPGGSNTYTFSFNYDAEGHIVLCEQSLHGTGISGTRYYRDTMIYTNGNLTEQRTYYLDDVSMNYVLSNRDVTTYGTEVNKIGLFAFFGLNEPISVTSGWNAFYYLFGNFSKNLPSVIKRYNGSGTQTYQWDMAFILNEKGYPNEQNIVRSIFMPGSTSYKFEYSCD